MPKVQVWVELSEQSYREYEFEARRKGVAVERLVEHTVNLLHQEMERDERAGTDHPLTFP
jgi:hypothetical protein